jgi:hypothetical protein
MRMYGGTTLVPVSQRLVKHLVFDPTPGIVIIVKVVIS